MISIVIPTYDQKGQGAKMLTQLLNTILRQTISVTYEIAISDTATNDDIKNICKAFDKFLPIRYTRNKKSFGASENINNAISLAKYDKVKLMCQDDLFSLKNSIDLFSKALEKNKWVISNSVHIDGTGNVTYEKQTDYKHGHFERNITGMPSVVAWEKCDLRFDPKLKTLCDMYFYHELYELYGEPGIIKEFTIAQRFHAHSLSKNQPPSHDNDRKYLYSQKLNLNVATSK